MMIHGTGGGFDQGLLFAAGLRQQGFRIIAPSRLAATLKSQRKSVDSSPKNAAHDPFRTHCMPYTRVRPKAFGGPEALELETVADLPVPQAGEVRIRVLVTSAAFTDVMIRKGLYPDVKEKPPFTPGYDLVGVVDAAPATGSPT